jgi:PAS domain S-box-containing protein
MSEEWERLVFENALAGMFQSTLEGRLLRANRSLARVFGYDSSDEMLAAITDLRIQLYARAEDREGFVAELLAHGEAIGREYLLKKKDGTAIWASISARLSPAGSGCPALIEGFILDISDRKLAEDALRESRQRLSEIIDFLPDATFVIDKEGRIITWNRAIEEMTGIKAESVLGKGAYEYSLPFYGTRRPILIDLVSAPDEEIKRTYVYVKRKGDALLAESEAKPRGEARTLWATAVPLYDSLGAAVGAIEAIRDITENKRAENELKRYQSRLEELVEERTAELAVAKESAEEANRAKSAFLANMSHELRTPLNGILGYAQILRRNGGMDTAQESAVTTIEQSGEHLLALINDILDISRIETRHMSLNPSEFELTGFLKDICGIIAMRAEKKGVGFRFEPPADLPEALRADEMRLRQVLLNLLGNAVKYTERGEVRLEVAVLSPRKAAGGEELRSFRFAIEDTGMGMSQEQLGRIFEPFVQVGEDRYRGEGVGLGLTISRALVRAMGGEIEVRSEEGKGSCFSFELELPVVKARPKAAASWEKSITGYEGARRRMLIVDDQEDNRMVLRDMLLPLGFDVSEAENGLQAVYMARKLHPDLVLMDLRMPVMSGDAAAHEIRSLEELRGVAIIAVSASAFHEDMDRSALAGCDGFIRKPVKMKELLAAIGDRLGLVWTVKPGAASPAALKTPEEGSFVAPSAETLGTLLRLARMGDMQGLLAMADAIEAENPACASFAARIKSLSEAFKAKAVLAFLSEFAGGKDERLSR